MQHMRMQRDEEVWGSCNTPIWQFWQASAHSLPLYQGHVPIASVPSKIIVHEDGVLDVLAYFNRPSVATFTPVLGTSDSRIDSRLEPRSPDGEPHVLSL